jgi:hypothetical protein
MSLPEISRRCLTCGAAVRAGSRFCQQCGKPLQAEDAPPAAEEVRAEPPPQERAAPPTKDWTPPTKEFTAFEQLKATRPEPAPSAPVAAGAPEPREVPGRVAPDAGEVVEADAGEAVEAGRAAELRNRVARVREGTKARVGRMREEAIVVLEETPDDSGLRFVLAAAALFLFVVVLLFLSTTVLR